MIHPILEGNGRKYYFTTWAIIAIAQVVILYQYYDVPLYPALMDGLVFNVMFLILGIGYWFVVRYTLPKTNDLTGLISSHVMIAFVSILGSVYLGDFILRITFPRESSYLSFLGNSLLGRGFIGMLYYAVIMLIYYMIQYYQDLQAKLSTELELKSIIKETELKMLKSQINPHFIFNSLNSISSLTLSTPEKAREMIVKMSDFLRYSLVQENEQITLKDELDQINTYLDIEKIRFGDQLIFESAVDAECLNGQVPRMILQPLFENAIKYGVYESMEPVTIKLFCENMNRELSITITNNFDPETIIKKGEGIGLANIRQRLQLNYGNRDLLMTRLENDQFTVNLRIPQSEK